MRAILCLAALSALAAVATADNCNTKPWPYARNTLLVGDSLTAGQTLQTARSKLAIVGGAAVLTRLRDGKTLWSTPTTDGTTLQLTTNGLQLNNAAGSPVWAVQAFGGTPQIAVLQDDCNFVAYETMPMKGKVFETQTKCVEVHIVPHSHDDVGWLLTPERYYDGCNTPGGGVRGILTSVTQALLADPKRTFVEVEIYFFNRWWLEQNETTKNDVRKLVKNGQLEFINAGWSMHDEACVHQESALSNMEVGAQFLKREFGDDLKLKVGWHIDPFGHASATPRYMAEMGFDAFFFWRTDYQQKNKMVAEKTVESMWHNSPSLGDKTLMFTSIMYNSYCEGCNDNTCPGGFCCMYCEVAEGFHTASHHPIMSVFAKEARGKTTSLEQLRKSLRFKAQGAMKGGASLRDMASQYAQTILEYAEAYRTGHVLIPWGCDFAHTYAAEDYALMDQLINEINTQLSDMGLHLFYSTATQYVQAVKNMNYTWPTNYYDYFLDSDNGHAYWSGYGSSRAEYKGFERMLMNERSAVDIALTATPPSQVQGGLAAALEKVEVFREALGVAQHHDSITGTEREHVRNRYQFLLTRGWDAANEVLHSSMEGMFGVPITSCPLANLSSCAATQALASGNNVTAYVFNPLAQSRNEVITIPVPVSNVAAYSNGVKLKAQTVRTWELTTTTDNTSPPAPAQPYQVYVQVPQQALDLVEVTLVPMAGGPDPTVSYAKSSGPNFSIRNENYVLTFSESNGRLAFVTNLNAAQNSSVNQDVMTYCPHDNSYSDGSDQASGAYIFRTCQPNESPVPYASIFNASVVKGPLCEEVRQYVDAGSNIQQAWRLCEGFDMVEYTAGIGEVDARGTGVEIILKLESASVNSGANWWTDAQALEMQPRVRNQRPNYDYTVTEPVAANFFPCNAFAFVNDTAGNNMAVLADRSRSTASMASGELEFLVQRRLLYDDNRGVSQSLDENTRVLTRNLIAFNTPNLYGQLRLGSQKMTHPSLVRFGVPTNSVKPPAKAAKAPRAQRRAFPTLAEPFPGATDLLPPQIHLHSRTVLAPGKLVLRLQHLFAAGEGPLAVPTHVQLKSVLPVYMTITGVTETDINAIVPAADMHRLDFKTCTAQGVTVTVPPIPVGAPGEVPRKNSLDTLVTLLPMQIRTFVIDFTA